MDTSTKKILIITPQQVSDSIIAQALFRFIKLADPSIQIDVLTTNNLISLFKRFPEVTNVIESPIDPNKLALIKRYKYGGELAKQEYDQAIVLQDSFKAILIPFFADIPILTGWQDNLLCSWLLNDSHKRDIQKHPLLLEQYLQLGTSDNPKQPYPYPVPQLIPDDKSVEITLQNLSITKPTKPTLAICINTEKANDKYWPIINYIAVINKQVEKGWQVWLLGDAKDRQIAKIIKQETNENLIDFVGKTTLGQTIDLLSLADVVIANDSGLMHIAAAFDKPMMVIYGPTSPYKKPPLSQNAKILFSNIDYLTPCVMREDPALDRGKHLRMLEPKSILELIEKMSPK